MLDLMLENTQPIEPVFDFLWSNYRVEFSHNHKWALVKKKIEQKNIKI